MSRLRDEGTTFACPAEGAPVLFRHARTERACPRFVAAIQDTGAGTGHRMHDWSTGLWVARNFNLTLLHTSLSVGGKEHGSAASWDEHLGIAWGENGMSPADAARLFPSLKQVLLPRLGHWGVPNAQALAVFGPAIAAHPGCDVLFFARGDEWPADTSPLTRATLAWKFAASSAALVRAASAPPLVFNASAVNVAVHFRVGDMTPTPEHVLSIITLGKVVPALRRAGVRAPIHVHVFTDGARPLPFFKQNVAAVGDAGLALFSHGDLPSWPAFWHFANADIFVGSLSSFSWMAGLFSSRPFALLQHGDPNQLVEYCADSARSAGCCWTWADCEPSALERLDAAAKRIAASEACGQISEAHAVFDGGWALEQGAAETRRICEERGV